MATMKQLLMMLLLLIVNSSTFAQNQLATRAKIYQEMLSGRFMQKSGTSPVSDNRCISSVEARSWYYVDEKLLPFDGRLPWYAEIQPQYSSIVTCTSGNLTQLMNDDKYSACGSYIYNFPLSTNLITNCNRTRISPSNPFWI